MREWNAYAEVHKKKWGEEPPARWDRYCFKCQIAFDPENPVNPATSEPVEIEGFEEKVAQITALGLGHDDALIRRQLMQCRGDVEQAINNLLGSEEPEAIQEEPVRAVSIENLEEKIAQISALGLGHDDAKIRTTLEQCEGDVDQAINNLLGD